MSTFFETLAPAHIQTLPVYQPGKPVEELERELGITGAIKIASNENPMGPSPRAVHAMREAAASVHEYPDGGAFRLRQGLCERLGVRPEEILFGAGSNEIIYMVVHALCRPDADEVLTHRHAFLSYRLAALAHGVRCVEAEVSEDLACDVDALIAAMTPRTKVVFLPNPNNPTGAHVVTRDLERILAALPERALLVVDEAYHEYAMAAAGAGRVDYPSSQAYRARVPRILTLRTFSKIHGLAGLRVGYGVGDARLIGVLERVRQVFNINSLAQVAALAALDDHEHLRVSCEVAARGIARLSELARGLGVRAYPSLGNFVLLDMGREADELHGRLLRQGVITRPMRMWGLPRHLRVSVGTAEQIERVGAALAAVLDQAGAASP